MYTQNTAYRLNNWGDYSRSLKSRGDVTLWIDASTLAAWREPSGRRTYSDLAVEVCLRVRAVFRLPLRQAEGFLEGLARTIALDLPVPDYSTLSRRAASLEVALPRLPAGGPVHLVVDSTGLKVYGEGEWKVRMHGAGKRRTWAKLHLGLDEASGLILARGLTGSGCHDGDAFPGLLAQVRQVSADGAYDWENVRAAVARRGAGASVLPRADAVLQPLPAVRGGPEWEAANLRNLTVHRILEDGRASWARESGYVRRAAAEWTMSRVKRSFGDGLRSRRPERQRAEAEVRCALLNGWFLACQPESFQAPRTG